MRSMDNMDNSNNAPSGAQAYRLPRAERSVGVSKPPFQGGYRGMLSPYGGGGAKGRGRSARWAALAFVLLIGIALPAAAEIKIERITVKDTPAQDADAPTGEPIVIATAHYPLYCLAERLCRDTYLKVIPDACPREVVKGQQPDPSADWFAQVGDGCVVDLLLTWQAADPSDDSGARAQQWCPDIVALDASALESGTVGIALSKDETGAPGRFWMSLTNLSRFSELISALLEARFPDTQQELQANLNGIKSELLSIQRDFAERSSEIDDADIFALSEGMNYFTESLGLNLLDQSQYCKRVKIRAVPILSDRVVSFYLQCGEEPASNGVITYPLILSIRGLSVWPANVGNPNFESFIGAYRKNVDDVFDMLASASETPPVP